MRTWSRQDGFTLVELMLTTAITLVVLGMAMTTFRNALTLSDTATLLADATQNLRAGSNLLVRDLMQTGRGIPTGGIPIPSGDGAEPINRPSPPETAYFFDNEEATTLPAITTGDALGPTVSGDPTDMVTLLLSDQTSYVEYEEGALPAPLELNWGTDPAQWPDGLEAPTPTLADDGGSLNVEQFEEWITDPVNGVKPGDLLLFTNALGTAIQTVTRVVGTEVFFDADERDPFNFNQRDVDQGSIMQIRNDDVFPQTTVVRIQMLTYFIDDNTTPGTPRLMRQVNFFEPQALAGVIEDMEITYDLVDGEENPTEISELPHTIEEVTYTANQIRKVNLHVGVRSDTRSGLQGDYMRHHLSSSISVRSLAYVSRYE
jgi:prepilin-type N-terminal cleavage/methylation domain-containing protein